MSENTPNKNVRNDEIDLLDLLNRMANTFMKLTNYIGRIILISVVFIIRRSLPLGISIFVGIGIAYIMKSKAPSIYTSDMVLRSNVIETSEIISYINKLQTFNKQELALILNIPLETSNNLNLISAFWIIDKNKDRIPDYVDYSYTHDIYDTTNIRMGDRLDIRVTTNYPKELNSIRDGIIKYINSDSLFILRNKVRLSQNLEFLNRIYLDIKQLDSLQKVKYFEETRKRNAQSGGQIVFMQEQSTQLLYNDIYSLYDRKRDLETYRDVYPGIVTVLSDFSIPTSRVNGLLFYARKVIPTVLIITLIILVIFSNRKKLKDIYNKY